MTRFPIRVPAILAAAALASCSTTKPTQLAAGPDCRPMVARVILSCWYGGRQQALGQCSVGREEPVGCGIGPDAVAYFNSGLDMSQVFGHPDAEDRADWVQFNVYRDATGRVGRKFFDKQGAESLFVERPFGE